MIDLDELMRLHLAAAKAPWDMGTGPNAELITAMRNSIWELMTELKAAREFVNNFGPTAFGHFDWAKVVSAARAYDEARDWGEDE